MEFTAQGYTKPLQFEDELAGLIDLLRDEGVRSYLEIGSCYGGSLHRVVTSLPAGSRCTSVDLPTARWGRPDSRKTLQHVIRDLGRRGYDAAVRWGNSHSAEMIDAARERGPYDAAFIDGDHTYDGARSDWLAYGQMARIVAFHDIVATGRGIEVSRLWRELKRSYKHVEILGQDGGARLGIGVLWRS